MQLFYNPLITEHSKDITFSKEESRHISKVLRKNTGDLLLITNGKGWLFEAEITSGDIKHCTATILSRTLYPSRNYKVHVAIAPTKMNDRFEWFLEKATEIGVDEITPIICDHSERKVIKTDRFEKIIQAAMKQSLHYHLPELKEPVAFKDVISASFDGQKFIAHCEETARVSLKNSLQPETNVLILIGPEGDFSTSEITDAKNAGFIPVTLGTTRLRTETAGIVACHSIAFINE